MAAAAWMAAAVACMAATTAAAAANAPPPSAVGADVGNWTVGDCVLAQFAMELVIRPNASNPNTTLSLSVPAHAEVDASQSSCGADQQYLNLDWQETSANGTDLARNITIIFARQNDTRPMASYGVMRLYGTFELGHFEQKDGNDTLNITSYIDVDTGSLGKSPAFTTPIKMSFLCADTGPLPLASHLHFSFADAPKQGTKLANATADAKHVQFDAFRTADSPKGVFQTPMDCNAQGNDIVPIAVGVALFVLMIGVIVAYLIGRRRQRQRGYESV